MRKKLASIAVFTLALSASFAASPASAGDNKRLAPAATESCDKTWGQTGGGLNGTTSLEVCHRAYHVTSVYAYHKNFGDHAHRGSLLVADNANRSWESAQTVIRPSDAKSVTWPVDVDTQNGWRVCGVWVKANGTKTNHFCMKMTSGGDLDND